MKIERLSYEQREGDTDRRRYENMDKQREIDANILSQRQEQREVDENN